MAATEVKGEVALGNRRSDRAGALVAGLALVLALQLAACTSVATKRVKVRASPISIHYTSHQIRTFLSDQGYERVKFRDLDSGIVVLEKRNSDFEELHFRSVEQPRFYIRTKLDKRENVIRVQFQELGQRAFSDEARAEFDRLLAGVIERVGEEDVRY